MNTKHNIKSIRTVKDDGMIIGICDDQKVYRDYIRKICEDTKRQSTEVWDIVEFTDGLELINSSTKIDILILDMEMPEVDGIQVKDLFQSSQQNTMIIYVTNHTELIQQAFGIHVLGFIEKENMEFQLPKILKQAFSLYETNVIVGKKYNSTEICYVEASHVYCCIHMKDSSVRTV